LIVGHKNDHDPLKELEAAFNQLDTDKSGYLDKEELKRFMLGCGEPLSDAEVEELLTYGDTNGDGVIDIDGK